MPSATTRNSVQQARKSLTKYLRRLDSNVSEELERSAQTIKANAIAQTPYRTGKLESSVYVRVSKDKKRPGIVAGASAKSQTGYDYAGIQHESTYFSHPIKGSDHYISDPFNKEVAALKKRLKRKLRYKHGSRKSV